MRGIRPNPGTDAWWNEMKGRTDARGAGVTGTVFIDGIGFQLGGHTPLPNVTVTEVGGLLAAALQNDPTTFTGYSRNAGIY